MPASTALAAGSILVPPLPPDLLPPVSANNAARIRAEVEDADVGSGIGLISDGAAVVATDLIDGATATAAAADSVQDDASEPPGILVSKYLVQSLFYTASFCVLLIPRYTVTMLQLQTIQTIETNIPVKITLTIQKERKNKNKLTSYIRS